MARFSPRVLPTESDAGIRTGFTVGGIIQELRAAKRGELEDQRRREAEDLAMEQERFRFDRELEDEGFVPQRDIPQDSREGAGAERGMFGEAGQAFEGLERRPDATPAIRPGQLVPGFGFSTIGIQAPAQAAGNLMEPPQIVRTPDFNPNARQVPPQQPTFQTGGRTFVRDPSRTPEAREQAARQAEIERIRATGRVPAGLEGFAADDDTLLRGFLEEDDNTPGTITADDMRAAGLPEEFVAAAEADPILARGLIEDLFSEGRPRRPSAGGRRQTMTHKQAMDFLDETYGSVDMLTGAVTHDQLSVEDRLTLADQLANGELDPADLPAVVRPAPEEEAPAEPGVFSRLFSGLRRGATAAVDAAGEIRLQDARARVPASLMGALAQIDNFPQASDEELTAMLRDSGYDQAEIQQLLQARRR